MCGRQLVKILVGKADNPGFGEADDTRSTRLDVNEFHLPKRIPCMQGRYNPFLIFLFLGMLLDGDLSFYNEIDTVVWFPLLQDVCSFGVGILIQVVMDDHKFCIGQASKHAVLAQKGIVYGTFTHR